MNRNSSGLFSLVTKVTQTCSNHHHIFFKIAVGFKPILNNYTELQNCVAHTIDNIFDEENSLLFLSDVGDEFAFPEIIKNPYAIANKNGLEQPDRFAKIFSNDENIILHLKQFAEVKMFNNLLTPFINWPQENIFLLVVRILGANSIRYAFEWLWKCNFFNVVVIGYNENYQPTLIYSDQFATSNECGRKFKNYVTGDCNSTSKHKFPNLFRKYPNCNIVYGDIETWRYYEDLKETYVSFKFLKTTAYALNMSFLYNHDKIKAEEGSYLAVFKSSNDNSFFSIKNSVVYYYEDMVWNVPPPKRISSLAVLKITFKPLLWLFVVLAFFSTSTLWWLLEKVLKEDSRSCFDVFFGVYSITLLGSIQRVPKIWALRYTFIAYVIYAIHIQTAFTSNLIQILTIAQYEPQINNLQDLADSNLSILVRDDTFNWLNTIDTKTSVHKKIFDKFRILSPLDFHNAVLFENQTNSSIFWNYDLFNFYERHLNKSLYYFVDNSFSGTTKSSFSGFSIVNLWPAFNRAVSVMFEAGIVDSYSSIFQKMNIKYYYDHGFVSVEDGTKVITLEHVSSVFVILILGLSSSLITFLIEILLTTFYNTSIT
ncbi:hypothetical protein FQR65_LT08699 [Abscondita terminalis]|nr:hypothetical protein FQR65_LT08699 [Abscondita terminalis]